MLLCPKLLIVQEYGHRGNAEPFQLASLLKSSALGCSKSTGQKAMLPHSEMLIIQQYDCHLRFSILFAIEFTLDVHFS